MAAFKESGAIEYSSDMLLALQLKGTKEEEAENKKLLKEANKNIGNKEANRIELVYLKHRDGYNFKVEYRYLNAFNYFEYSG